MRAARKRPFHPGFSLIEVVFTLALLVTMTGAVCLMFSSNNFGSVFSPEVSQATSGLQAALGSIAGDFRPGSGFAAPSNAISATGVHVTSASGPAVEYYQDGDALKRLVETTGSPTTTVLTGLATGTGLTIKYYDSGVNLITGTMNATKYGQATMVDVSLTVNLPHASFGQVTRTMRILLRNKVS